MFSPTGIAAAAGLLFLLFASPAPADQPVAREVILNQELNGIESRVIQRKHRQKRTLDLLTRQDLKVSERRLNTLKTRSPRNARIPFLARKLDRIQRSRRFHHR